MLGGKTHAARQPHMPRHLQHHARPNRGRGPPPQLAPTELQSNKQPIPVVQLNRLVLRPPTTSTQFDHAPPANGARHLPHGLHTQPSATGHVGRGTACTPPVDRVVRTMTSIRWWLSTMTNLSWRLAIRRRPLPTPVAARVMPCMVAHMLSRLPLSCCHPASRTCLA